MATWRTIFRSGGRTRPRARTGMRGGRARSLWRSGDASASASNPARVTRLSTAGPADARNFGIRRRTMPATETSADSAPGGMAPSHLAPAAQSSALAGTSRAGAASMGAICGRRPVDAAMHPPRGKAAPARDGHGSGRGFLHADTYPRGLPPTPAPLPLGPGRPACAGRRATTRLGGCGMLIGLGAVRDRRRDG